jgi:hypothetical protein
MLLGIVSWSPELLGTKALLRFEIHKILVARYVKFLLHHQVCGPNGGYTFCILPRIHFCTLPKVYRTTWCYKKTVLLYSVFSSSETNLVLFCTGTTLGTLIDTLKPMHLAPTTIPLSKALKSFVLPIHPLNGTHTQSMSQLSQGLKKRSLTRPLPFIYTD